MTKNPENYLISKEINKKLAEEKWVESEILSGRVPQEILGFTNETMADFYVEATHLFEKKSYQESSDAFAFLVAMNPHHCDYWLGLGASTEWLHDYEAAIDAYEMAAFCDLSNPYPYFHLAKCLFSMHEREGALQAIELTLEYSGENSQYEELHRQALAAKNLILQEQ